MNFIYVHITRIFLLVAFNFQFSKSTINELPLWTWECINERCVPVKVTTLSNLQSLKTCCVTCSGIIFWPEPTGKVAVSTTIVYVTSESFVLKIASAPSSSVQQHLEEAFQIFRQNLYQMNNHKQHSEQEIIVTLNINENGQSSPKMLVDTDESYDLQLQPANRTFIVDISANSFCGARHGLETLSQLIWFDEFEKSLVMLTSAKVSDAPQYSYRGIMLDTASSYIPVNIIKRTIDGMAASKLNTFHWLITNSQMFPLHLDSVPFFAKYRTFGETSYYKPHNVQDVAKYAQLRGIRLLLDITFPTMISIGDWQEQLILHETAKCKINKIPIHNCTSLFDTKSNIIYELLGRIYRESSRLTGVEDVYHLGNDICTSYLLDNFNSTDITYNCLEFIKNILQLLKKINKETPPFIILWSSNLMAKMKEDLAKHVPNIAIHEYSLSSEHNQNHVKGLKTIVSHENSWLLNNGYGTWFEESHGAPFNSWQQVYENIPWSRKSVGIEGGEGIVWSSTLSSGLLDAQVWPRAAALAERLWADRAHRVTSLVEARLDAHRERLVERGIRAAPIWSKWCSHNPQTC